MVQCLFVPGGTLNVLTWLRFALINSPRIMRVESGCVCSMVVIWSARNNTGLTWDGHTDQNKRRKTPVMNKMACS